MFIKAGQEMGQSIQPRDESTSVGHLQIYMTPTVMGKSFRIFSEQNRIMDEAKAYMLRAIYDAAFTVDVINTFKIGEGGTITTHGSDPKAVAGDRTDLFDPYTTGYDGTMPAPTASLDGQTVTFTFSIADTDMNGEYINEVAMFRDSGTIFNMKTFPSILKTSGFALTFIWTIRHN